jgi:signal transduction histidine kinase
MKIRGRLIVAFLIITVAPLLLMMISAQVILRQQNAILKSSYQAKTSISGFIFHPIHVLYTMTMEDYDSLVDISNKNPDQLCDMAYLTKLNDLLEKQDSFLIVRKSGIDFFIGDKHTYAQMGNLPGFSTSTTGEDNTLYIDRATPSLIKEKDFYFSDHSEGQFFLITDLTKLLPRWETFAKQLIISWLLIMLTTALLLIFWIYNSIVKPLNILRIATCQIGVGKLDEPVRVSSTDEIGELCRDFEEMRLQLKDMIEKRIQYESDTREMISNMAHDLQTPLTSIKGYSEGILDGVASTDEKKEKYLRIIYTKASDMSYLVDELSVFARVEQNDISYHFIAMNLEQYFSDCLSDVSLDLEMKHIQLIYQNDCPADTTLYADPEQFRRVIGNVLSNSVKYMNRENGEIKIHMKMQPLPSMAKPLYQQLDEKDESLPIAVNSRMIEISIWDNGPGVESKDIPQLFKRFYRADASRNSAQRGSGLGLAIVEKIVSAHGGRVWAESQPGKGLGIYITLRTKAW